MYSRQLQGQLYSHSRKEREADAVSYYERGVEILGSTVQHSRIKNSIWGTGSNIRTYDILMDE
jgi:hypothetical protein